MENYRKNHSSNHPDLPYCQLFSEQEEHVGTGHCVIPMNLLLIMGLVVKNISYKYEESNAELNCGFNV